MKILNITEEGRGGGPLKRIAAVAQLLKLQGIETIVAFPAEGSENFQENLRKVGVEFEAIRLHRLTKDTTHLLKYILFFIPEIYSLIRIINKHNIDVVHANGSWQIKGMIAAKFTKAKAVWHLNDMHQPKFVKMIFNVIAKIFADGFIVASDRTRQFYLQDSPLENIPAMEIQAPVNVEKFNIDPNAIPKDITAYEGLKITTVGYVNPNKGLETYIRMAAKINSAVNKPVHFFVAGTVFDSQQQYYEKLQALCKELNVDNVHFLGYRSDIKDILNVSDIYVCSSDFEASPISIWEAMAMQKAIVSTDVGDVYTIFKQNDCGKVVPVKDYERLAEEVIQLIDNESYRKSLGLKARDVAINKLDLKICTQQHASFYKQMQQHKKEEIASSIAER